MRNESSITNRSDEVRERAQAIKDFRRHFAAYNTVNALLLIIIGANLDQDQNFFTYCNFTIPFWWGVTIIFHAIGAFGQKFSFGKKWEQRKIEEYMNRQGHRNKWL